VQAFSHPINDRLMERLIMAGAAGRASARSINAVIPYFGYARQEKKDRHGRRSRPKWWPSHHHRLARTCHPGFFHTPVDHPTALDPRDGTSQNRRWSLQTRLRVKSAEKPATYLDASFVMMMKSTDPS